MTNRVEGQRTEVRGQPLSSGSCRTTPKAFASGRRAKELSFRDYRAPSTRGSTGACRLRNSTSACPEPVERASS